MRLDKLRLLLSPGIKQGFTLEPEPGLNLVTGPNGIGKSSVCRAVRALLWPVAHGVEPLEVEAEFFNEGRALSVTRQDLDDPVWQGIRPDLGPDHLAERYELGVLDLLNSDRVDDPLAREIRRHVTGGFDLEQIRSDSFEIKKRPSEARELKKAMAHVAGLQAGQKLLENDRIRLKDLENTRDQARRARDRQAVLESLRQLADRRAARQDALARLEEIPAGAEHVREEDPGKLAELRRQEKKHLDRIEERKSALEAVAAELAELERMTEGAKDLPLDLVRKKIAGLGALELDVRTAEREAHSAHQDEVVAEAARRPALWPPVLGLLAAGGIVYAGSGILPPGSILSWIVVALGGGLGWFGILGTWGYFRGRKVARTAFEKRLEIAARKDRLESCRKQAADTRDNLNAELEILGLAAAADAAEAGQSVDELKNRRDLLVRLLGDQAKDTRELGNERDHLARVRGDIQEIFDRLQVKAGPQADAEISPLVDAKPHHVQALQDRRDADHDIARLDQGVAAGNHLLEDGETDASPAELGRLIDREEELAAELDTVQEEISRIRSELGRALEGHDLQDALAAAATVNLQLLDVRQANRESALGHLLLKRVELQHEKESRPAVLEKADEYFQLFTGGRYELKMVPSDNGQGRFQAAPADSVTPRELHQLSDGTRAQLLLAVKLAFITAGEKGARPPIFLDDSLTSADPERFAAVAASLGRLADEQGRQIFYLTPNPADAAAFGRALDQAGLNPAHHIDLAAVRGRAGAVDPSLLDFAGLPAEYLAPDPAGLTAAEYAEALAVPRPDPWASRGGLHVLYLLEDNLELVRRLVDGHAPTINRFDKRKTTLVSSGQMTDDEAVLLSARGRLWDAWLDGWRIGRARPVTRGFLKSSGAVSEKSLEKMMPVLQDCGGDGALLLEAIDARKVKGFLSKKRDQLQQELEDADLLAHGAPLDTAERDDFVDDRIKNLLAAGLLDMPKVRTLALTFARIIDN